MQQHQQEVELLTGAKRRVDENCIFSFHFNFSHTSTYETESDGAESEIPATHANTHSKDKQLDAKLLPH